LDGRTTAAKRARGLAEAFKAELGGTITASVRMAIERAAQLVALSEDARVRRLAGDPNITLDDLVRIDNAAVRAVRALGIKPRAEPKRGLREYVAELAAADAAKATPP
jgi:hypothetical protein